MSTFTSGHTTYVFGSNPTIDDFNKAYLDRVAGKINEKGNGRSIFPDYSEDDTIVLTGFHHTLDGGIGSHFPTGIYVVYRKGESPSRTNHIKPGLTYTKAYDITSPIDAELEADFDVYYYRISGKTAPEVQFIPADK